MGEYVRTTQTATPSTYSNELHIPIAVNGIDLKFDINNYSLKQQHYW